MFARFFLLILSTISLAWIIYIGYDLLDQKDNVSPQHIFSEKDGEILIINRSSEVNLEELDYKLNPNFELLFLKLLQHVYPNERIYISEKRSLIIIEIPNIWTEQNIQNYFDTKESNVSNFEGKKFKLNDNFTCFYKKNYLLITTEKKFDSHQQIQWPLWDNKASASIIHLSHPLKSTNIYFKGNGIISYQTKYGPKYKSKKIDDKDLFSQFLPSTLVDYHFFEKEFALNTNKISSKSPLFQWMEDGMVLFSYQNTNCILSDYNKLIDPINLLRNDRESDEKSELSNKFSGIELIKGFTKEFYIGKLADKVLISEKKLVLEKIIADYQLGNTLALNSEKTRKIFDKMPKKVSERNLNFGKTYSLSSYKNLIIKTQLYVQDEIGITKENPKNEVKNNNSFVFLGDLNTFLGNSSIVYSIGKEKEIIALSNKKQIWKYKFDGEIIGNVKLIDINENGTTQLLFNTNEKIYLISSEGAKINEFPVPIQASNSVSFFRWNSKSNFLIVTKNNELLQLDQNGRTLKKLKLPFSNVNQEVDVYKNGKILTAIISSDSKTQMVDLEKNKILNSKIELPKERIQLKQTAGYFYFENNSKSIIKYDQNGIKSTVYSGTDIKNLKKIYKGKQQLICFQDVNQVIVLNENGQVFQKVKTSIQEIDDFDMITASNGTTYLAILDEIENDIYIFDFNGKQIIEKSFEGKNKVKLNFDNGKLNITSLIQNYIVQYYDVLK